MLYLPPLQSTNNYKQMEFKDRIKHARTKKGLSQSQLAKAIGVHVTNISRYERKLHQIVVKCPTFTPFLMFLFTFQNNYVKLKQLQLNV